MQFVIILVIALMIYAIIYGSIQFIGCFIKNPRSATYDLIHTREKLAVFTGIVAGLLYYFLN
jgi:hypothetical protein